MVSFRALRQIGQGNPLFDYLGLFVLSGKSYVMFRVYAANLGIKIVMSQTLLYFKRKKLIFLFILN